MRELIFHELPARADTPTQLDVALKRAKKVFVAARAMTKLTATGSTRPILDARSVRLEDAALLHLAFVADARARCDHPGEMPYPLEWSVKAKGKTGKGYPKLFDFLNVHPELHEETFYDMLRCRVDSDSHPLPLQSNVDKDPNYPKLVLTGQVSLNTDLMGCHVNERDITALAQSIE